MQTNPLMWIIKKSKIKGKDRSSTYQKCIVFDLFFMSLVRCKEENILRDFMGYSCELVYKSHAIKIDMIFGWHNHIFNNWFCYRQIPNSIHLDFFQKGFVFLNMVLPNENLNWFTLTVYTNKIRKVIYFASYLCIDTN